MRRAVSSIAVVGLAILLNLASAAPVAAIALFTNDPLIASTSIKAIHITELRVLINALRAHYLLAPFVFTDANLAGVQIKAVHVTELRTALQEAYAAAGMGAPVYTDPTLTAHATFVKAIHITQIRNAIVNLDTPAFNTINLGTYPMGQVWAQLNGAFAWAVDAGSTLPTGTSLRTDVPPWFQPGALAGIIGIPTAPGTYKFTLLRTGVPQAYRLRIIPMTFKDYFQAPDAFVGKPFTYQLSMVNAIGGVTWAANPPASLPPGMSLSAGGLLSGTPTVAGNYQINFSAADSVGQIFGGIQMNIFAVEITTNGTLPNVTAGVPYNTMIAASGGSGGHTFTSNGPPFGLALASNGALSGTTTVNPGNWSFNVTATDSSMNSYSKRMSLDILSAPMKLPSVFPSGSSFTTNFFDDCSFGSPCVLQAMVTSGGKAAYSWTASGLPMGMSTRTGSGLTTSWINPGNLEIWGAPAATGTFPVQLSVQDVDGRSATNTFNVRVSPMALTQYPNGATVGTPFSHYFRVIGGRLPYTAAIVARRLPLGITLDSTALTLSGTPTEAGNFAPVVEFTDADGAKLRLTIYFNAFSSVGTMLVNANEDFGTILAGSFYSNQLNACCAPSGFNWSVFSGALPTGLALSAGGVLSGTPTVPGTYTFVVKAEDNTNATNFALRQIVITVTPISFVSANLPVGHVGTPYSGSIIITGFTGSVTGALEPFQYMPPGLTFHSDGTIDGTPTQSGQYTFTARATDSAAHIFIRTFTINVYPAGVNPPVNLTVGPTFTVAIGGFSNTLQAFDGTPPYTYSLTPPGTPQVPGMRVQSGQPLPTNFTTSPSGTGGFLGVLTTPGSYQTSIRATDSLGGFIDRPITMNVTPLRILSLTFLPTATIGVPYSFTFTPFGGSAYTWAAQNLPPGITLDTSTGTISGTPSSTGNFNTTITLTDAVVTGFNSVQFALVVNPFKIVAGTNGVLPNGTVGVFYNQTLTTDPVNCGSGCTWSVVTFSPPFNVTLSPGGVLSGTPTGTFNGSFQVQATGSLGTVVKTVSLRIVASSPQPLTINNGATFGDSTIGNNQFIGLDARGGTEPYTWGLDSGSAPLPPGIAFLGPGETLGFSTSPGFTFLTGRPMVAGLYNFTIAVTDGAATKVTKAITWRISELSSQYNTLPIAGNPLTVGVPYSQPLLFTGGSGSYTFTNLSAMPAGLTLSAAGVVSGTPTVAGSFFNVSVQAVDTGGKSLTQNITFNVSP